MNLKDNLDKLPKWAQQEVGILQMKLNEAKSELNRVNENPVSNTFTGFETTLNGMPPPVYLKDNQQVTFRLEKGEVSVRVSGSELMLIAHGEGDFVIKPHVSNSISIRLT